MFLETLRRRNPGFIQDVVRLHQEGELQPNTYVLDYRAIGRNIDLLQEEASRLGLRVYPMTKQIGRNPAVLRLLAGKGLGRVVVVDWLGAGQVLRGGGRIGHVGHLVQVPRHGAGAVAGMDPEVWTVFSYEKAREAYQACARLNRRQKLLVRVRREGDFFYPGQEGGVLLEDLADTALKINELSSVRVVGVTSFPCLLFDEKGRELAATPNLDTLVEAAGRLEQAGVAVEQINAPGTTSTAALEVLRSVGATHVEPGHGLTGTTPLHAFRDLPEEPAVLYLSEVSHLHGGYAYCFGGGLYVDPVVGPYPVRAMAGSGPEQVLASRYEALLPDPAGIDYYGRLRLDSPGNLEAGDTVLFGFRPQVFHTRGMVSVIERGGGPPRVMGLWDANGNPLQADP
ncbi:MAG: alanine racemase [Spirochaetota bacterium]